MQVFEKLLPLIALVGVGAFLFYLLRLARAERPPVSAEKPAEAVPVAAPVVVPLAAPVAIVKEKIEPAPLEKIEVIAPPVAAPQTPVHAVLELLKSKDSIATAFVLREILDPPVSRR